MNPLRARDFRIPFNAINAEHIEPGVREALSEAEASLGTLVQAGMRSYDNTLGALSALVERLSRVVTVAQHLTAVMNSPEIRAAYNAVLPEFSSFFAKLPLNEELWQAVKALAGSEEAKELTHLKKRHLDKVMQDFRRAGADLPPEKKARLMALQVELSQLQNKFTENVLDSLNAFELVVTDPKALSGLPDSAIQQARASAEAKGKKGWRFTLQAPSYLPFMQYADTRELRRELYLAYVNRASEGEHDNRPLIAKILELRREKAELLGYADFADYRLEVNMAKTGEKALAFVRDLTERTKPYWQQEVQAVMDFAAELGIKDPQPWDVARPLSYVSEKLRKKHYDFDEEALRPYFPLEGVMAGLFEICRRIFGIRVRERTIAEVWHEDVKFYDIHGENGLHLGSFYADWFPRESKQSGAWMNAFITGGPTGDGFAPHLGVMVGNFMPPAAGKPALLNHDEVTTLFHEFGHLLHHCLSRVEVPDLSGTNVPRDWVELPSQILENWCWEREALDLFARHFETGERIPDELFQKMLSARTFMAASHKMRQLSFAMTDLALHILYDPQRDGDVVAYSQKVMADYAMKPDFAKDHFVTGFSHVFSGGYAAGYYSYKWSEMLDADAFTRFKAEGIFSRKTGQAFVNSVLSRGYSAEPEELFREFMGRDPELTALLERNFPKAAEPLVGARD